MDTFLRLYLAILFIAFGNVLYISYDRSLSTTTNYDGRQVEITARGNLLNNQGQLIDRGFARQAIKELNEVDIFPILGFKCLSFLRYKKWDGYSIITDKFQLLVHLADVGYASNAQLILYIYESDDVAIVSDNIHIRSKVPSLSTQSIQYEGTQSFETSLINLQIKHTPNFTKTEHIIQISFTSQKFSGEATLTKTIGEDEIVMMTPISEDGKYFFYNMRGYGLKTKGTIKRNNKQIDFDETNALGGRDIGRGIWFYKAFWFWVHGQGFIEDSEGKLVVPFGINLGNGFEHESSETQEDCIILSGRLHKLMAVKRTLNEDDLEIIWTLKTQKQGVPGSLDATFDPAAKVPMIENYLLIQSKLKRFYGIFKGSFIDENGKKVMFDNIYGLGEVHEAKW